MMSFLKTLQKFEQIIIGDKKMDKKPKDHWKKYRLKRKKNKKT